MDNRKSYIYFCVTYFCVTGVLGMSCNFTSWNDYINSWQRRYFSDYPTMYPYGDYYCDTNASLVERSLGLNPKLPFDIHYAGVLYKSLWISVDGAILLNTTLDPPVVGYIYRPSWPNTDYPNSFDPPLLFPFFAEADFRISTSQYEKSRLSYRILNPNDNSLTSAQRDIIIGTLLSISRDIQMNVVGESDFQAKFGLVVTWYSVTFQAAKCSTSALSDTCVRNTYQAALVVQDDKTFTIFNYLNIKWIGGAGNQRCDPNTGVKSSSSPECDPAQIGFNAGYGRFFKALPYSNDVVTTQNIDTSGGTNVTGRYIYKVSEDRIVRGGCSNDSSLNNDQWQLEVFPRQIGMTGGEVITISGPCFHKQTYSVQCRFGSVTTEAVIDPRNMLMAVCVPPFLTLVGNLPLEVSSNAGMIHKQQITVNLIGRNPPRLQIDNPTGDWLNVRELPLTWSPSDLGGAQYVNVVLFGYREQKVDKMLVSEWIMLRVLATNVTNTGYFTLTVANVQCTSVNTLCTEHHVGLIRIITYLLDGSTPRSICSDVIPLAWYSKSQLNALHGSTWPSTLCSKWEYSEMSPAWHDEDNLPPCPCTYQQALVDFGRFQPDVNCNVQSSRLDKCQYHPGAKHCVVSTYATFIEGSGTRCCYDPSDNLMYAQDVAAGSRTDRSHEWGKHPYTTPPLIPSMSHWVRDVLPWYQCCEWQQNKRDCTDKYIARRMTRDCVKYAPPGLGLAFGDPHIMTPDGTAFTFNGRGEFWLASYKNIQLYGIPVDFGLQARFVEVPTGSEWGNTQATMISAVAMRLTDRLSGAADIVTFIADEFYATSNNKMMVYVNREMLDFKPVERHTQEFKDFIIVNLDQPSQKFATNFTIAFRLGIGVNVKFYNGLLQVTAVLPPEFMGKTNGLFGLWNGNGTDDLVPFGDVSHSVNPDDSRGVHYSYGLSYMVTGVDSLFVNVYRAKMTYDYYNDYHFVPIFYSDISNQSSAPAFCGTSDACHYDYAVTMSSSLAQETLRAEERGRDVQGLAEPVVTCGLLDVRNGVKQQPVSYLVGSTVTIIGCTEGFKLKGHTTYTCQGSGDHAYWSPAPDTQCMDNVKTKRLAVTVMISVGVVIAIVFLIILIIVIDRLCRKRQRKTREQKQQLKDQQEMEALQFSNLGKYSRPPVMPGQYSIGVPVGVTSPDHSDSTDGPSKKKKDKTKSKKKREELDHSADDSDDSSEVPTKKTSKEITKETAKEGKKAAVKPRSREQSLELESDDSGSELTIMSAGKKSDTRPLYQSSNLSTSSELLTAKPPRATGQNSHTAYGVPPNVRKGRKERPPLATQTVQSPSSLVSVDSPASKSSGQVTSSSSGQSSGPSYKASNQSMLRSPDNTSDGPKKTARFEDSVSDSVGRPKQKGAAFQSSASHAPNNQGYQGKQHK